MPYPRSTRPLPKTLRSITKSWCATRCTLRLGIIVTESSGHNSEYNWWFRKRPDLIEKYCTHGTGWNPGEYAYILKEYQKTETTWKDDVAWNGPGTGTDLDRGQEYAAYIINALKGGEPFKFNGNVPNTELVTNLPQVLVWKCRCGRQSSAFIPFMWRAAPPVRAADRALQRDRRKASRVP